MHSGLPIYETGHLWLSQDCFVHFEQAKRFEHSRDRPWPASVDPRSVVTRGRGLSYDFVHCARAVAAKKSANVLRIDLAIRVKEIFFFPNK